MARKTVLNRRDSIRVADALRANWETIAETKPLPQKVAKQLSDSLNLIVTKVHVLAICRDLGLDWPSRRRPGSERRDRVRLLCKHLIKLYEELGVQAPQELLDEVRGLTMEQRDAQQEEVSHAN